jgi:hypothetical protein
MASGSGICELEQVVDGAEHGPFLFDLVEAAQEELSEASGCLDMTEHRFDDLLSQAVATSSSALLELGPHRRHARAGLDGACAASRRLAVSRAACGDVGGNVVAGQHLEVGLAAVAGVGREFLRIAAEVAPYGADQGLQGGTIGRAGGQVLSDDDLLFAVNRGLGVVTLDEAALRRWCGSPAGSAPSPP